MPVKLYIGAGAISERRAAPKKPRNLRNALTVSASAKDGRVVDVGSRTPGGHHPAPRDEA